MAAVRFSALFLLCAGCTEYGFASPGDDVPIVHPRHGPNVDDSTGDTGPIDTGSPPEDTSSPPEDTEPAPDACYEPEDGYAENPAARILTDDAATPITVTYVYSDTDYDDELWIDSPTSRQLVRSWADSPGLQYSLGPWGEGTELVFGLQVNDTGDHWQSGPGSRNSDGVVHGAVTYEGSCSWLVGFEDLNGGGDRDYNDVVFRVQGMLRQES